MGCIYWGNAGGGGWGAFIGVMLGEGGVGCIYWGNRERRGGVHLLG